MSIINLIYSRGYLPTCRVMQLLLWMSSMVHDREALKRELFVDVGANIGINFIYSYYICVCELIDIYGSNTYIYICINICE